MSHGLPSIYLAGPEVFLRDAETVGRRKKALCWEYGFVGLFPLDQIKSVGTSDGEIYRGNVAMLAAADFVIANITPFRGPNADPGTAFEMGLAIGLRKRVYAYTNVPTDLLERVTAATTVNWDDIASCWRDPAGMSVENFGNADNLMIDCCVSAGGFRVARGRAAAPELYADLSTFRICLEQVARDQRLSATPNSAGD